MSKFDFEYMANDEDECVVFNKAKWTKEKALLPAIIPSVMIVLFVILMQFLFFGSEEFEAFFGVAVGKFNPLHCLIVFVVSWLIFALIFRSDYKEV